MFVKETPDRKKNKNRECNGMRAFDLSGVASFPRIPSVITLWDLILYDCAVIDVKFRIASFDKNEPSSSY